MSAFLVVPTPKDAACVCLTDDPGIHQVEDLPSPIDELELALAAWNHIYEEVRPHQALGYLTPNAFYAQWLTDRATPWK